MIVVLLMSFFSSIQMKIIVFQLNFTVRLKNFIEQIRTGFDLKFEKKKFINQSKSFLFLHRRWKIFELEKRK